MSRPERRRLNFEGITTAPSQVSGAVRLVPLLRDRPIDDLRLYSVPLSADLTHVVLGKNTTYTSYVPHAMVAELEGAPKATLGSRMMRPTTRPDEVFRVEVMQRLARRQSPGRLRFLPQHLGVDAYLSLGFSGPDVAWPEYSREVLSRGLSPRSEWFGRGAQIRGFADALRVFEMHPSQVGVLVFVADAFASAFITPRPADYRRLHRSMLNDLYGGLMALYAMLYPEAPALWEPLDAKAIGSLEELSRCVDGLRTRWGEFAGLMASELLDTDFEMQSVQRLGGFRLWRFRPLFRSGSVDHVGDFIADANGRLAYLSTVRLSAAQSRRGHLLATLVKAGWDIRGCATALGCTMAELGARFRNNGLERLFRDSTFRDRL